MIDEPKPWFNGEDSDFEDDVVELDFEDQFEKEQDANEVEVEKATAENEPGIFGAVEKYDESKHMDMEPTPIYPDGLTEQDVVHPDELTTEEVELN